MLRDGRSRLRGIAASSFGPWIPDRLWSRFESFSSSIGPSITDPIHPRLHERVAAEREAAPPGFANRPSDRFENAAALVEMDWGEHRKGILGGWGIDKRDPTADPRLIDVDRLRALVRDWPDSGWENPRIMGAYRIGLLKGLTAGHFILAAGG